MDDVGGAEILLVLMGALLVLGPSRLPDAARSLGRALGEFRRVTAGFQAEVWDAIAEPPPAAPEGPPSQLPAGGPDRASASGTPNQPDGTTGGDGRSG